MTIRRNRNRYDIYYSILKAAHKIKGHVKKTKLCHAAYVNPDQNGTKILNELIDAGLITFFKNHYRITDKGISFIISFSSVYDLIKEPERA